ncbi:MAG: Nif3-like dinuclear metal center hexameric protein [Gemmatimonadota bacterium]
MADLQEIVEFLDGYLRIAEIEDYPGAWNGLQVGSRAPVEKVCAATDACQATIEMAAEAGGQLLLVHHGLFWAEPLPITGRNYRRLRVAFDAELAVYSAHLPLDVHAEVGNNVRLAAVLGLTIEGTFGRHRGVDGIGVWAATDLSLTELSRRVEAACGAPPRLIAGGPGHVRRVGIVTGGAGSLIGAVHREGLDTFITGEGSHHTFHDATELGVNVLYAGHYATETLGVKALAGVVAERFELEWAFLDHPTGL